jgi:hypothetical protein
MHRRSAVIPPDLRHALNAMAPQCIRAAEFVTELKQKARLPAERS